MGGGDGGGADWRAWAEAGVADLRSRKLLRTLRPVVPTGAAVEAHMHEADVAAWLEDREPTGLTGPRAPLASLTTLRLFSLNDYLGLSSHPDVCRAAAEAALQARRAAPPARRPHRGPNARPHF